MEVSHTIPNDIALDRIRQFLIVQDAVIQDPWADYAVLRHESPIRQSSDGIWIVSGYNEVRHLLRDPRVSRWAAAQSDLGPPQSDDPDVEAAIRVTTMMLINRDEPDHTRLRQLVRNVFLPHTVKSWLPRIQAIAHDIVLQAKKIEEPFDFVKQVGYPLPEIVICELAGVPYEDRKLWSDWARAITGFNRYGGTSEDFKAVQDATLSFYRYIRDFLPKRRAQPGDDILSSLIRAEEAGDKLNEDELIGAMILFVTAGHDTTANLISNTAFHLLTEPHLLSQVRADIGLIPALIEEILRAEAPAHMSLPRCATEDIDIQGNRISAGDKLIFVWGAANRDPAIFDRPDEVCLDRSNGHLHIGFGSGIHTCLGMHLARLEAGAILKEIILNLPPMELVATPRWRSGKPRLLESLMVKLQV